MKFFLPPYNDIDSVVQAIDNGDSVLLGDHLNGFDFGYNNQILTILNKKLQKRDKLWYCQILNNTVKNNYSNLDIGFDFSDQYRVVWKPFENYTQHPDHNYKNFICSFNGSDHVSRKLLVAVLERFGYFNAEYCSKNFVFDRNQLDGHIQDYVAERTQFYRKFFIADNSDVFFNSINTFGHIQYKHEQNICNLESKLTQSFLHLVSESLATSYVPFVTEKFLYSIATRGLFLAYAQPGWHDHVEKYYGFKKYSNLFDYRFDSIQNPVKRLIELVTMVGKFKNLSISDWTDLYQIEQDTVEYNYDHYFSGGYLQSLRQHEN